MDRGGNDPSTDKIQRVVERLAAAGREKALPPECAEAHRIDALEREQDKLDDRMTAAEESLNDGRVSFAIIQAESRTMKDSIDKLNGVLSKLNWILVTAVVLAVIGGVVKLTHP